MNYDRAAEFWTEKDKSAVCMSADELHTAIDTCIKARSTCALAAAQKERRYSPRANGLHFNSTHKDAPSKDSSSIDGAHRFPSDIHTAQPKTSLTIANTALSVTKRSDLLRSIPSRTILIEGGV